MWGETTRVDKEAKRLGGKRPGGKRLGGETSCYRFKVDRGNQTDRSSRIRVVSPVGRFAGSFRPLV